MFVCLSVIGVFHWDHRDREQCLQNWLGSVVVSWCAVLGQQNIKLV